jgi:hypothetical protein
MKQIKEPILIIDASREQNTIPMVKRSTNTQTPLEYQMGLAGRHYLDPLARRRADQFP